MLAWLNKVYHHHHHPPSADEKLMQDHLFQTLTLIETEFPNCGVILTGDFNRLNVSRLLNHFCLKGSPPERKPP